MSGRPADTAAWGAATLLSSHAGTSPTGDERHSESQSGPRADSVNASQLAAGPSLSSRPDVTPDPTASVNAALLAGRPDVLAHDDTQSYAPAPNSRLLSAQE
jgi:hypothetical protein